MIEFTTPQKAVLEIVKGNHLVLAPPGTGKTDILSHRIDRLLQKGVNPSEIICLTFTNRAAVEMQQRIESNFGETEVFIGNIHKFCQYFLRSNNIISQSQFILDEVDMQNMLLSSKKEELNKRFPDFDGNIEDQPKEVKKYFVVNNRILFQNIVSLKYKYKFKFNPDEIQPLKVGFDYPELDFFYNIFNRYELKLKELNALDFDDLIGLTLECLTTTKFNKFRYIHVDEVQDLNRSQWRIIQNLSHENATNIYFGDIAQSIYSFMGADHSTLQVIRNSCTNHSFNQNFRSPQYILEILNDYAIRILNLDWSNPPISRNTTQPKKIDLVIREISGFEDDEYKYIAEKIIPNLDKNQSTAILVRSNKTADKISNELGEFDIPHFKVSGMDLFQSEIVKLLIAFFSILNNDYDRISWIRLIYKVKSLRTLMKAGLFVKEIYELGFLPSDFLLQKQNLLEEINLQITQFPFVIFDTETTGLDTLNDDIVQIAAIMIYKNEIIDEFEVFLHTDKDLSPTSSIHGITNEDLKIKGIDPKIGLSQFIEFIGNHLVVAHNLDYDSQILQSNLSRFNKRFPDNQFVDSLDFTKRLYPSLPSYKLEYLLDRFKLEGVNSHNALDDVKATKSLIDFLFPLNYDFQNQRDLFLKKNASILDSFTLKYQDIFKTYKLKLKTNVDFSFEFKQIFSFFKSINPDIYIPPAITRIIYYIEHYTSDSTLENCIQKEIESFKTFKESDLILDSDNLIISTFHKAKGLQFDNIIITHCNNVNFPLDYGNNPEEDARLLYVALSRSKKSIIITYNNKRKLRFAKEVKNPMYTIDSNAPEMIRSNIEYLEISPFLHSIISHFNYRNIT